MGEMVLESGHGPTEAGGLSDELEVGDSRGAGAAIWVGIESRLPHAPGEDILAITCAEVSAFIDELCPGARARSGAPGSFCLRCAGSVGQVMHIVDELAAHLRILSASEDVDGFDARIGIAIATPDEASNSVLRRAEEAAWSLVS